MHAPAEAGDENRSEPAQARKHGRPDTRLPRARRLRSARHFKQAFEQRRRYVGRFMILIPREAPDATLRVGVVAGKRTFRRAVDRGRAKRLLREVFRLHRYRLVGRSDVVLVARHRILTAPFDTLVHEFIELATRAGLAGERSGTDERDRGARGAQGRESECER